jgi:adenylosuccinate synthase
VHVDITVGGLYGDEGKELVYTHKSLNDNPVAVIRSQGCQHGGEVWWVGEKSIRPYVNEDDYLYDPDMGERHAWRQLPAAYNEDVEILLAPGAIINPDVLFEELETYTPWNLRSRLKIDPRATVISEDHIKGDAHLKKTIKSVGTGYRSALVDRIMGVEGVLAKNTHELKEFCEGVSVWRKINDYLDDDKQVLVLGTQSTHLSTYYGEHNTNAYDNTASTILGQCGIGPNREINVCLVVKSFVSRVGGREIKGQLTDEKADELGWVEHGTVSGRRRKVAPLKYHIDKVQESILLNTATYVALTKVDYLYPEARGVTDWSDLPEPAQQWIEELEQKFQVPKYGDTPIAMVKTGPHIEDVIDMRLEKGII